MAVVTKNITIATAHEALMRREFSAVELTEAYLKKSAEQNERIHAYLGMFDTALGQARRADLMIARGKAGALTGIPIAIKDNILVEGEIASAASKMLANYHATYDATVVMRLKRAGAVFLGRTNMDEFAMGSSTENSAFGAVLNPHDESRVAGGSSGGSAAAVAMGGALAALGSDTGGSIRQPASFCGVVGLKPTYGRVSRVGLIAMGSSLDQIGPITKTVYDAELLFNAIAGHDPMDSTSIKDEQPTTNNKQLKTIGVPRHMLKEGIDRGVQKAFEASLQKFSALGYEIRDITLPYAEYALPSYYIIMPAECSTNLARYDGVRFGLHVDGENLMGDYVATRGAGFGAEVRRRILIGTYVLSSGYYESYYRKAQDVRRLITADFTRAFQDVSLVATPTTPTPAFRVGEKGDPLAMYLADIFTVSANLTGMPALSIPMGLAQVDGKELPLGLQLTAPHMLESRLFYAGKEFTGER